MPVELSTPKPPGLHEWHGPTLILAIGFCVAATLTSLSFLSLPAAMALPAFSVIAGFTAACVALLAWLKPSHSRTGRLNSWDIVGALTLIGISAALLSDPEQVIPLLEARQTD